MHTMYSSYTSIAVLAVNLTVTYVIGSNHELQNKNKHHVYVPSICLIFGKRLSSFQPPKGRFKVNKFDLTVAASPQGAR